MTTNYSRNIFLFPVLVLAMLGFFSMTGCKGPVYPNCKNDSHCKVGASGEALTGVCVFGKCEECAMNSDCKDGMQCMNNMCMTPCSGDGQCGDGNHCEDGFCHKNCDASTSCGAGRTCTDGRCVSESTGVSSDASCSNGGQVHFDFDKYDINSGDMTTLDQVGMCLRKNTNVNVVIEGHTDERGSTEYNLALGQRRADAVRKYLSNNGVSSDRLKTISYGKEKPVDAASNEEAWAKNRRSEIVPQ